MSTLRKHLPRTFRPEVYQGKAHPRKYFEGWYHKLVDGEGQEVWAFIAGMSYAEEDHAFVQVIHANSGQTWYLPFHMDEARPSRRSYDLALGPSHFSGDGLRLDLESHDFRASGEVQFLHPQAFPGSLLSPGIMGWYSYVPGMECYHGVVSMGHGLEGELEIQGKKLRFDGGRGYIEKDWGSSMPSDWIWIQSNHFEGDPEASLMLSVARIPWMKNHFLGFLSFFKVKGKLHRFATYNGANIEGIHIGEKEVVIRIRKKGALLEVRAIRKDGGILKAPRHGQMDRSIQESIISRIQVSLRDADGTLRFEGEGRHAGLEIVGDVRPYL